MSEKTKKIIIGSRGSELALWQANFILEQLTDTGVKAEIKIIKTKGDNIQDIGFDKMEGKGFFTKELEDALLSNKIDLAVHSHKDVPTTMPKGLVIGAVSYRENPSEILLINKNALNEKKYPGLGALKQNAVIGTSSARRKSQILAFRPDLKIEDLRGNVPTRIQKLRDNKYDAIMLAKAGIERLGIDLDDFHTEILSPKEFIPAPAQGVLAIQVREADKNLITALQKIHHPEVSELIGIERGVLNLFDGGCQLPLGVYCEQAENKEEETIYKAWVAKAEKWNTAPQYFYLESKKAETFAEKIVTKINGVKPCKVFITRDIRKNDFFQKTLEASGYNVNGISLIETKRVTIQRMPKTDWIFFSSKNAVKHFFEQAENLEGTKLAAVGKATSDELRKFNKKADFIGYSTDTKLTGKQFAALVGSKTILFPQAKGSMKTIQQQFINPKQIIDISVYETIKNNDKPVPYADVVVFTSPSNVEAYLEKNKISEKQKIVAMGDATANALRNFEIKTNKMPATFDDMGLVQAVFSI